MPLVSIIMPQLGESIAEATVINLLVKEGDRVQADQDVIEVETNKATMNVRAPGAGRVEKILVKLNESYPVGAVLGRLEVTQDEAEGATYMSPRMKARMHELGLHAADLAGLAGSGAGGRVTIQDFEKFIANLEKSKLSAASSMRVAVADAMRRSWTRPLATVALP